MANESQNSIGAVQPAESAPSGNENQMSIGAVQPTDADGGVPLAVFLNANKVIE